MSNASDSSPLKWVRLLFGVALIVGALALLAFTGMAAWAVWGITHPAPPKVAAHVSVDVLGMLAGKFMGELVMLFIGVRLLQPARKKETAMVLAGEDQPVALVHHAKPVHRAAKRWTSCNVLQIGAESRRLWTFGASKSGFTLNQEESLPIDQPLPAGIVGRDWKTLFQPKLNIALLPVEQVFLRVAQLPVSELSETLAMVELQLEKLSPLPVTQIVWSVQVLPHTVDNLQTIIVIIMERDLVEKFLGELEGLGYLADRLELPILDQLLATPITDDGAYIYPDGATGKFTALAAWWYGGVLRNLGLLHVPDVEKRDEILKEQLTQMAWAGELEGWLHGEPRWHLVADEATAANWRPLFQWTGEPIMVQEPVANTQLATLNANRAARADLGEGIMPPEYAMRYHQEFIDRLWMRAVGSILAVYIGIVIIYMAGAAVQNYRAENLEMETASRSRSYTNALQLKAQLEILQNRQALKFASLDCWKVTAELLPEGITIQTLEFKDGKHFNLSGSAPGDQGSQLTDFNEALRKATKNGQPMFEDLSPPISRLAPGGGTLAWSFGGELAHAEEVK